MKNINLNELHVQEMNIEDMQNTEGGIIGLIFLFLVGVAIGYAEVID